MNRPNEHDEGRKQEHMRITAWHGDNYCMPNGLACVGAGSTKHNRSFDPDRMFFSFEKKKDIKRTDKMTIMRKNEEGVDAIA